MARTAGSAAASPEQQIAFGRGVGDDERLVPVAHGDELIAGAAVQRPPGGRPVGVVEHELQVEFPGGGVRPGDGVAALELFRPAVGVGEPQSEPGAGLLPLAVQDRFVGVLAEGDAHVVVGDPSAPDDGDEMVLRSERAHERTLESLAHGRGVLHSGTV